MSFGIPELLVVLAIVLLLFGTKKLKSVGSDLGGAIKGFKKAMNSDEEPSQLEADKPESASTEKPAEKASEPNKTDS